MCRHEMDRRDMQRDYSRQPQIRKLLPQHTHERLADLMFQIIDLILVPLGGTSISPNRTDIDHAIPKLHKRAPLDGDIQIRDVVQDEVDQLLEPGLAEPLDEGVCCEGLAEFEGREAVLREAVVEEGGYVCIGGLAELFLLFYEVGTTDEADCYFLSEGVEEGKHFGGGFLCVA